MKKKLKILSILILFLSMVVYLHYLNKNKGYVKIENSGTDIANSNLEEGLTKFTNVEYQSTTSNNKKYTTKGESAYFKNNNPNLIQINGVYSFTNLKDGSILKIKSDKANYFKMTKNVFYIGNVIITNLDKKITSNEARYIPEKSIIELDGNIIMTSPDSKIIGDQAKLNTVTNEIEIFMESKSDKVYGQRKQQK